MKLPDLSEIITRVAGRYQYQETPSVLTMLQDFLERLLQALSDLLASWHLPTLGLADSRLAGNLMQLAWYAAAALALVAISVWLGKHIAAGHSAWGRSAHPLPVIIKTTTSIHWRQQAEQLAENRLYKEACRALYLSLLQSLHESKLIPFAAGKTNYEYLQALSSHHSLQVLFRQIVRPLENIWFGNQPASESLYRQMRQNLDNFNRQIAQIIAGGEVESC